MNQGRICCNNSIVGITEATENSHVHKNKKTFEDTFDSVDVMESLLGIERFVDLGWTNFSPLPAVKYRGKPWTMLELSNLSLTCRQLHLHFEWIVQTHKASVVYTSICLGRRELQHLVKFGAKIDDFLAKVKH